MGSIDTEIAPQSEAHIGVDELLSRTLREIAGVRELLRAELDGEAVHDVRKGLKRVRARLRLLQPVLAKRSYERASRALRETASALGGVRDAAVRLQTFDELLGTGSEVDSPEGGSQGILRASLERSLRLVSSPQEMAHLSEPALAQLDLAEEAIRKSNLRRRHARREILRRLVAEYRLTRRRALKVSARPANSAKLHELRKHVQRHRYQLAILRPSKRLLRRNAALDELAWVLGRQHDLAELELFISGLDLDSPIPFLLQAITYKSEALIERAHSLARALFTKKSQEFRRWLKC